MRSFRGLLHVRVLNYCIRDQIADPSYRSAWIGYGTFFAKSLTVQWRMPLCLCPLSPLVLLIGIYWIPESPRWLVWDGQNALAWQILQRIHHDPTDSQDLAAHAEFIQIERQVAFDKEIKTGWVQMFTNPTWRKRTLLAFLVVFAVQSAGINVITTYLILEAEYVPPRLFSPRACLVCSYFMIMALLTLRSQTCGPHWFYAATDICRLCRRRD